MVPFDDLGVLVFALAAADRLDEVGEMVVARALRASATSLPSGSKTGAAEPAAR